MPRKYVKDGRLKKEEKAVHDRIEEKAGNKSCRAFGGYRDRAEDFRRLMRQNLIVVASSIVEERGRVRGRKRDRQRERNTCPSAFRFADLGE